jgi:hypothetical protein
MEVETRTSGVEEKAPVHIPKGSKGMPFVFRQVGGKMVMSASSLLLDDLEDS